MGRRVVNRRKRSHRRWRSMFSPACESSPIRIKMSHHQPPLFFFCLRSFAMKDPSLWLVGPEIYSSGFSTGSSSVSRSVFSMEITRLPSDTRMSRTPCVARP